MTGYTVYLIENFGRPVMCSPRPEFSEMDLPAPCLILSEIPVTGHCDRNLSQWPVSGGHWWSLAGIMSVDTYENITS